MSTRASQSPTRVIPARPIRKSHTNVARRETKPPRNIVATTIRHMGRITQPVFQCSYPSSSRQLGNWIATPYSEAHQNADASIVRATVR